MDKIEICEDVRIFPNSEKIAWYSIKLNDKPFLEMVRENELPYASKDGQENLAGSYMYASAEHLYKQLKDKAYRFELNKADEVDLLGCLSCGIGGCWDLLLQVREEENIVIWENFYNNHRKFWNYSDFGPFKFDKDEYYREVEKLKEFATEILEESNEKGDNE